MPFSGEPRQVLGGCRFLEGPVWLPAASPMAALARLPGPALVFSDLQVGRLLWWTPTDHGIWREDSGGANGNALDPAGRLVTCEHGGRRVTRTEVDGTVTVLATHWQQRRLNSPNDVVVQSNGAVYFSDPPYGVQPEDREIDVQGVYRLASGGGEPELLAGDFVKPNGLAFSPDERLLYVADTERGLVRSYTTPADGQALLHGRDLCQVPRPDGLRLDVEGNLYVAALDGVQVFDRDGRRLATLELPERPANLAFGGEDGRTLFICARTSLYACRTRLPGATVAA